MLHSKLFRLATPVDGVQKSIQIREGRTSSDDKERILTVLPATFHTILYTKQCAVKETFLLALAAVLGSSQNLKKKFEL